MTVLRARWRASRILSPGSRPSIIARYAEADRGNAPIPLPLMVSVYRYRRPSSTADTTNSLTPLARKAGLEIRAALSERQRYIVLTGPTKSALSAVTEWAVGGLHYERLVFVQASLLKSLLDRVAHQRETDVSEAPLAEFILVIENVDLAPDSSVRTLADLADHPRGSSVQMVFVGRTGAWNGFGEGQYRVLVGRPHVQITLAPEASPERTSTLEDDLTRAWQNADERPQVHAVSEDGAISPYPALAALLGQPARQSLPRGRTWMLAALVILVCLLGNLLLSHTSQ